MNDVRLFSFLQRLLLTWFLVPPGETKFYRSPFLRDFWHLNVAMMTSNNALIPDPDKEDILASKPLDWPFLRLGLRMCGWADNQVKYYLLGTPFIWWAGTASLWVSLAVLGIYLLRHQRRFVDMEPSKCTYSKTTCPCTDLSAGEWDHFLYVGKIAFLGWFLHFGKSRLCQSLNSISLCISAAPFLIMGRVTYVHHYVSALTR